MRIKRLYLLSIGLILILVGCTPRQAASNPTPLPTRLTLISETPPNLTPSEPTLEPPRLTVTPTPSPVFTYTPRPTQTAVEIQSCQGDGVPKKPDENFGFDGVIAFQTFDDASQSMYFTVGGNPLVYSLLPLPREQDERGPIVTGFSPNGEWLGYTKWSTDQQQPHRTIGLLSYDGTVIEHEMDFTPLEPLVPGNAKIVGLGFGEWINNELVDSGVSINFEGRLTLVPIQSILDPINGSWEDEFIAALPGFNRYETATFSPDMSRVVYPSVGEKLKLALIDTTSNTEIWSDDNINTATGFFTVQWAPDSSIFAYNENGTAKIFLANRDGGEKRTVQAPVTSGTAIIYGFWWSPQNHLLAFSVFHTAGDVSRQILYVFDSIAGKFVFQCPLYQGEELDPPDLVWSPDSRYLAYSYRFAGPTVLLDLQTGQTIL